MWQTIRKGALWNPRGLLNGLLSGGLMALSKWTFASLTHLLGGGAACLRRSLVLVALLFVTATNCFAADGFYLASALRDSRAGHTATLLPSGKVLVVGGFSSSVDVALAQCEIYDPISNTWAAAASLTTARSMHTATLLSNGTVLVVGGYNPAAPSLSAEIYDPATNRWSAYYLGPTQHYFHTATLLQDGRVLIAGGRPFNSSNPLTTARVYNPATGLWSAVGPMANSRSGHTASLLPDGRVLVTGGQYGGPSQVASEIFDPAVGTWSTAPSLTDSRTAASAVSLSSGKVLVSGGTGIMPVFGSTELYDPTSNSWSTGGSLATARNYHTSTRLLNGKVLVVGGCGDSRSNALSEVELYDPLTNAWSAAPSLLAEHCHHTATLLADGRVLVAGGMADWYVPSNTVEIYGPKTSPPQVPVCVLTASSVALPAGGGTVTLVATCSGSPSSYSWTGGFANGQTTASVSGNILTTTTFSVVASNSSGSSAPASITVSVGATAQKAALTSPTPGSTLPGTSATFGWSAGNGVSEYFLYVGTATGANDLYGQSQGTSRSVTVNGLPTDGRTLYVRLWSKLASGWQYDDYTYKAASGSGTSNFTITVSASPAAGGTVSGGGTFAAGTSRTVTATANSAYTFAYWTENGTVVSSTASYAFTVLATRSLVANFTSVSSSQKAALTSPAPGSTLLGASAMFAWSAGSGVTEYFLYVGNVAGSNGLYGRSLGTGRSVTVSGLPTDGRTLYVRLWSKLASDWQYTDYTYKAASSSGTANFTITISALPSAGGTVSGGGTYTAGSSRTVTATASSGYTFVNWTENGSSVSKAASYTFTVTAARVLVANFTVAAASQRAVLTSPAPGSTLAGASATFSWSTGSGVGEYFLYVGSIAGSNDLYGRSQGTNRSVTVSGLPTDGRTLYVRLWSKFTTGWQYDDYLYKAASNSATSSYTITVSASPSAGGSVSGGGTFTAGTSRTVSATANSGYEFTGWTENGSMISSSASYTFTVAAARNLVANFTGSGAGGPTFAWPIDPHPVGRVFADYVQLSTGKKYHAGMDIGDGNYNYATVVKAVRTGKVHKIFGVYGVDSSKSVRRWNPATGAYSWGKQPVSDRLGQAYSTDNHGLGLSVIIYHEDLQLYTLYGHLDAVASGIDIGSPISTGTPIGIMGNSYKYSQKGYLRFAPPGVNTIPQGNPPDGYVWSDLVANHTEGFAPHVHLEVKDRGVLSAQLRDDGSDFGYTPGPAPGVTEKEGHPNFYGYHDPKIFLNENVVPLREPVPVEALGSLTVYDYPSTSSSLSLAITTIPSRADGRLPAFVASRQVGNSWYQIFLPNSEAEGWSASGWIPGNLNGIAYARPNFSLTQIKISNESARVYASQDSNSSTLGYSYGSTLIPAQRFVAFDQPAGWYRIYTPRKLVQGDGWVLSGAATR